MIFSGGLLLLFIHNVVAQRHDADLMSFVTVGSLSPHVPAAKKCLNPDTDDPVQLPEVRALKWEVHHHDRESLAPGYWFVAPYGQISPDHPTQKFQQYQVGPYIYDNDGVRGVDLNCLKKENERLKLTETFFSGTADAYLGWFHDVEQ